MGNGYRVLHRAVISLAMAVLVSAAGHYADKKNSGEMRLPAEPSVPGVDIGGAKGQGGEKELAVTVVTVKGESMTGSIIIKSETLEIEIDENGASVKKALPLAAIDTIEFSRWRGMQRRKNEFAFYPSLTKITMTDKKIYECARAIPALNRLLFKNYRGKRFLYAYFYDYRVKDRWKNSGEQDLRYPETNPLAGTLLKITFARAETKNPLEQLLFR
jgi:hypothetical protein